VETLLQFEAEIFSKYELCEWILVLMLVYFEKKPTVPNLMNGTNKIPQSQTDDSQ